MNSNICDKVTLVVPTCDRPHYLHRLLSYYGALGFPVKVLVLDSSARIPEQGDLRRLLGHERVSHERLNHDVQVWSKITAGLHFVSTPYCVLCGDDDFLTVEGMVQAATFLEENPDYEVAQGYHLVFRLDPEKQDDERFCWSTHQWPEESIERADPIGRLQFHFAHYQHTFYGMHRTDTAKAIYKENVDLEIAPYLAELLPSIVTTIRGKMKVLDVLYQVRELIPSKAARPPDLPASVRDGTYQAKYAPFRRSLARHLSEKVNVDNEQAARIVDEAMFRYFAIYCRQTPGAALLWRQQFDSQWIPWFDFRNAVGRPGSEYYDDFEGIRRHVLTCASSGYSQSVLEN